jgi:hypothetical protein
MDLGYLATANASLLQTPIHSSRSERGVAGDIVNIAKTAVQVANDCRNAAIDYRFVGERKDVGWKIG